jgi:hypothetical protein
MVEGYGRGVARKTGKFEVENIRSTGLPSQLT